MQLTRTLPPMVYKKGFPPGKLGLLLATLYEIKLNGLELPFKTFKLKSKEIPSKPLYFTTFVAYLLINIKRRLQRYQ